MIENIALTENNDKAYSTSGNCNLDFFVRIVRGAPIKDLLETFRKAWIENKEIAIQNFFNMRDVRGGKGEKLIPQILLVLLKKCVPNAYQVIVQKMIDYGYWKDVMRVVEIDTRLNLETRKKKKANNDVSIEVKLFAKQLESDIETLKNHATEGKKATISLCGKWAPREKSHFNHHPIFLAKKIMTEMKMQEKEYRKMLSKLNEHLNILEMLMSKQEFEKIDFSQIPSVAMRKMRTAFSRESNSEGVESEKRKNLCLSYKDFLQKLSLGKTKVNVKGTQPHELVNAYSGIRGNEIDLLIEGQWTELKNRVVKDGAFRDVTAIVDVSGSMEGTPMDVAIALGILVAECTEGPFHGQVITFHSQPSWHHLIGNTLRDQVKCMRSAPWGQNTNMKAVFDLILSQAMKAKLKPEEMVKTLFIFTDMQFDSVDGGYKSSFEDAKINFEKQGYQLPKIVCWNLRTSSAKTLPVTQNENGFVMLSGFSAELLKSILTGSEFTPFAMMMHVLGKYDIPDNIKTCVVDDLVFDDNFVTNLEIAVKKSEIKKMFKEKGKDQNVQQIDVQQNLITQTDDSSSESNLGNSGDSNDSDSSDN